MSAVPFTFARPLLADQYCDALQGLGLIDVRSGLFLAAPRRTGKSTFLRTDLLPAFARRNWVSVYVDLWTDRAADPGRVIAAAIKGVLAQHAGAIAKLAKKSGLEKVNLFGALSVNVNALDLPATVTLADALEALHIATRMPVAIVIDEAQDVLSTQQGMDAMFALKAARDHLNPGGAAPQKLFLVFTGSNQDKLARMVQKKSEPFYGCDITKFPLLGKAYSDAYTTYTNARLAPDNQFSPDAMWDAFQLVGQRPEKLRTLVGKVALEGSANALSEALKSEAELLRKEIWQEMESQFNSLTMTQQAVLVHLIRQGKKYEPFTAESLAAYSAAAGKTVKPHDAQAALEALRKAGLVWKAVQGDYALEDDAMAAWYQTLARPENAAGGR
ncbi:hypothetical protein ACLB1G_25520 [Oxalobacteraceae bacterium A2-2]